MRLVSAGRKIVVLFVFAPFLLFFGIGPLRAERLYQVPSQNTTPRQNETTIASPSFRLPDADLAGRQAIYRAAWEAIAAETGYARRYNQVEYLNQRALHLRTLIDLFIRELRELNRFEENLFLARTAHHELADSPTMQGLESMSQMVGHAAEEAAAEISVFQEGFAEERERRNAFAVGLAQAVPDFSLTVSEAEMGKKVGQFRDCLVRSLKEMNKELVYLEVALDRLPD